MSDDKRQELAGCIGLTPTADTLSHVLGEVQRLLGQYVGAVQAIDNAPRPSDYVRAYRRLDTQSHALSTELRELSPRLREQLEAWLMDSPVGGLEHTEKALDALARALSDLTRVWNSGEGGSSGRPRNSALRMTVHGLQAVFREHYAGPRGADRRRGAIKINDEKTVRERRFVTVALQAANIPIAGLEKLF